MLNMCPLAHLFVCVCVCSLSMNFNEINTRDSEKCNQKSFVEHCSTCDNKATAQPRKKNENESKTAPERKMKTLTFGWSYSTAAVRMLRSQCNQYHIGAIER